jgi:hypothetical protein
VLLLNDPTDITKAERQYLNYLVLGLLNIKITDSGDDEDDDDSNNNNSKLFLVTNVTREERVRRYYL